VAELVRATPVDPPDAPVDDVGFRTGSRVPQVRRRTADSGRTLSSPATGRHGHSGT
jgi:hypothetical protein